MHQGQPSSRAKWYYRYRWALIPAIAGILVISYVIATEGRHGAWALWIAVPLVMISLGFLFLVTLLTFLKDSGLYDDVEEIRGEEGRKE